MIFFPLQIGFDLSRSESNSSSSHGEFLIATVVVGVGVVVIVVVVVVVWLSMRVNHTHIITLFWMGTIVASKLFSLFLLLLRIVQRIVSFAVC